MIYDLAFTLHTVIENHEDVLLLKELEQQMNEDPSIKALYEVCHKIKEQINEALEYYDIESAKIKTLRKNLANEKYVLDTNPLVVSYNKQYRKVSAIYQYVSNRLFNDFCASRGCKCQ